MPNVSIIQRFSDGTPDGAVEFTTTVTQEGRVQLRAPATAGDTDQNYAGYALNYAKLKSLWISGSGNDAAVTIETNSGSSPGHTFTIPAGGGVAVAWAYGQGTNPLGTTSVTGWYFTNPGDNDCAIVIEAMLDAP